MKKKLTAVALIVCMIAIMLVGASLAYFTDETETKNNTFTVGNVKIELTEPSWGEEEAEDVYPGEALAKDPTVTNTGANPCFVRVKVTGLDQFVEKYGQDAMIDLRHGEYVAGYDSTNWTYYEGYYYYNKVLATEETAGDEWNQGLDTVTEPVFNQIVMPVELTEEAQPQPISIYAEAVQAQGAKASWSDVKGMTVAEIATWFGTCGMDAAE